MSEPIHIPGAIHIPAGWEIDEIPTVRGKLFRQTGYRRFGTEILAATLNGELPADGCVGLLKGSGGNLENARALGRRASVDWDDIAEWLRAKGYDVRRGHWIEFDEALTRLQARISPAPTAAELESWIWLCGLKAYVDARSDQRYLFDGFLYLRNAELPERRLHLWLDSEEVAAFEPPCRWLTLPQLCERWQVDEPKVQARLKQAPGVISWPLMGDENPELIEFVVALESVHAIESEHPAWLKFDAYRPDRQLFPWLDLRDRDKHDAQRQLELMRSDPAGELGRLRAAEALGMARLSHWLEPERIARLYCNSLVDRHVTHAIVAGTLPARRVCAGFAIHVDEFAHWPGMPPIPEGAAGELVRAWLSLATEESRDCEAYREFMLANWDRIKALRADRSNLEREPFINSTVYAQKQASLREIAAELEKRELYTAWDTLPNGFDPKKPLDYVPVVASDSADQEMSRPFTEPEQTTMAAEPVPTPEAEPKTDRLIQRRVEIIAAELAKSHQNLLALPYKTKVKLMHRLLSEMPDVFTSEPTFNAAWTDGSKAGRFGMAGKEKFKPRDEM